MAPVLTASYFLKTSAPGTSALTTASFTPADGEVVIVKLSTWDATIAMSAPTGGSQTYTSRVINGPAGFFQWCGLYSCVIAGSPGAMTITSSPASNSQYSMCVERWTGAQLAASPATGSSAPATSQSPSGSITATSSTSVISWVAGDVNSADPTTRTYLNSAVEVGIRDGHIGSNGVDYYAYQASTGVGAQTYGLSTQSGAKAVTASIEVLAAAASTASFPPRRRGPNYRR